MSRLKRIGTTVALALNSLFVTIHILFILATSEAAGDFGLAIGGILMDACDWIFRTKIDSNFFMGSWQFIAFSGVVSTCLLLLLFQIKGRVVTIPALLIPVIAPAFYFSFFLSVVESSSVWQMLFLIVALILFLCNILMNIAGIVSLWKKQTG